MADNVVALFPSSQPCPMAILKELADLAYRAGDPQGCIEAINDLYALFDATEV